MLAVNGSWNTGINAYASDGVVTKDILCFASGHLNISNIMYWNGVLVRHHSSGSPTIVKYSSGCTGDSAYNFSISASVSDNKLVISHSCITAICVTLMYI